MAKTKKKGFGASLFRKDPDVLPFFTIHPKTKVGTIIRVAMSIFCVLALILMFLFSKGIMFLWIQKYYFLVYLVPAVAAAALLAVALFKRMKTSFMRIAVPGVIIFFGVSVIMSIGSMLAYSGEFALVPKMMIQNDDEVVVLMRACEPPKPVMIEDNGVESAKYPVTIDAYRYSVRVPEAREGISYTIEGEILIPMGENVEYEVKEEWVDDNTFRMYIARDTSETGRGEILVKFASGETTPASAEATGSMLFRKEFAKGDNRVYFYRENSKMVTYVDSPYMMKESDMKQVFCAYPRSAFVFVNLNTKTEGSIIVEPNGVLDTIQWEWNDDRTVARLSPAPDNQSATGSIVIYFEENGMPGASWGEATPVEATVTEATVTEASSAEADV